MNVRCVWVGWVFDPGRPFGRSVRVKLPGVVKRVATTPLGRLSATEVSTRQLASRVADLHAAVADPDVAGILTVIGGFNSNQLLPHLDWDLIAAGKAVFHCEYSKSTNGICGKAPQGFSTIVKNLDLDAFRLACK